MRRLALAIALGFLLAPACKPPPVDLSRGTRTYKPKHYDRVLTRWTREGKIIRHFDTNLHVHATYWSWDFTWAYAVKRARMFRMSKQQAAALRTKLLAEKTKHHEFYVAAATQDRDWNDFNNKDSIWRISLIDDRGRKVEPTDVKKITEITEVHRAFFPYTKLFFEGYHIKFPRNAPGGGDLLTPTTKKFMLQFAGPKGHMRLTWKVVRK